MRIEPPMILRRPGQSALCDVLVVDNGTNYLLFGELGRHMQTACGLKVIFLTLVPARVDYFKALGLESRVLPLSGAPHFEKAAGEAVVRGIEDRYSRYRFDLSVRRDRILRWYPRKVAERLLFTAAYRYGLLLDELQPCVVLGEISWAIEHLFFYVAESRGIVYRHLLNLPGRELLVAAFDASHTAAGTHYPGLTDLQAADSAGKSYYELCHAVKGYQPSLRYFLRNFRMLYSPNDYRQALVYRLRRLFIPVYRILQWLFEAMYAEQLPMTREHLLLVLHVQPESTPDYVAPFDSDQIDLARRIADSLKHGQYLYVKDHPNVLSIRNLYRWVRLLGTRRVRLLPRRLPGKDVLGSFQVVISIAGTALFECSRLGIAAISMSDVFFNDLPNVVDGRAYPVLSDAIAAATAFDVEALTEEQAHAFLARHGLPAFIHDARIAPDVVRSENIERLGEVVESLLRSSVHHSGGVHETA